MKLTNLIPIKAGKTLSRLCIIGALSLGSSFVFAQNQQVRLSGSNLTLKAAFKQIEQQTKLFVDYNTQDVNDSRVSRKFRPATTSKTSWNNYWKAPTVPSHSATGISLFPENPRHLPKQKKSQALSKMKKENRSSARMLWRRGRRMVLLPI